jgi:hypothetical protein
MVQGIGLSECSETLNNLSKDFHVKELHQIDEVRVASCEREALDPTPPHATGNSGTTQGRVAPNGGGKILRIS